MEIGLRPVNKSDLQTTDTITKLVKNKIKQNFKT